MATAPDSRTRFSGRVADYVRWRPGYPSEVVRIAADLTGLTPDWHVADLGSGTGLSARPFLQNGNTVFAVEPNADMRHAAEGLLGGTAGFVSVDGSAENTGLPDLSVDLVVAGQAFHWFDRSATREECLRILRKPGWAMVMWNTRKTDADGFARGYEALLQRWGTDYAQVRHRRITREELTSFFGRAPLERTIDNEQVFDLEGLKGRNASSSYVPAPGHPDHEPMTAELEALFAEHAHDGVVRFVYDAQLFVGRLD